MGYSEFPDANLSDFSFHELIKYYKETAAKYDATLRQITETNNRLTEYEKDVNGRINGLVESAIDTFKGTVITEMNRKFTEIEQNLNNKLADFRREISIQNQNIEEFESAQINARLKFEEEVNKQVRDIAFDTVKATTNNMKQIHAIKNYLVESMESLEDYVDSELQKIRDTLPTEIDSIGWLWKYVFITYAFTAYEWYQYPEITCEKWNESNITCTQWHTSGKHVFDWYNNLSKFFSPITGERVDAATAIIELCNKLNTNALTAGEYDALKLTADEFDRMFMRSGDYDWLGSLLYNIKFDCRTERSSNEENEQP